METTLTPHDARLGFIARGESQAEWARRHGVCAALLSEILAGKRRCLRGQSHRIAVLLGIKRGVFFDQNVPN